MKALCLILSLLAGQAWGAPPQHCYFRTASNVADSCGSIPIGVNGTVAVGTTPCIGRGTHNLGPTDNFNFMRSQVGGDPAFKDYWASLGSFSLGTYVYINTVGANTAKQYVISWSDLGTLNRGLYLQSNGTLMRICMETGNATGTCSSYIVGAGECWWIGYSSDSVAGKNVYGFNTSLGVNRTALATNASTEGTGAMSYVQWGRYVAAGGSTLSGYINDMVFYNYAVSDIPFDSSSSSLSPYIQNSTSPRMMPRWWNK